MGEAATRGVLWKTVFLKILQNSQENTCARVSHLINLQAWALQAVFLWILQNIFKNTFLTDHLWATASRMGYRTRAYLAKMTKLRDLL